MNAATLKLKSCGFCGQSDQDVFECSSGAGLCRCAGRLCPTCLTANFGGAATEHAERVRPRGSKQAAAWMCPACDEGDRAVSSSAAAAAASSSAAAASSAASAASPRFPLLAHPALSDVLSSMGSPRAWQFLNPFELREGVRGMTYHTPLHPCALAARTAAATGTNAAASPAEFAAPVWDSYQSATSSEQPAATLNFPVDHRAFGNLDLQYAEAMQERTVRSQLRDQASSAAASSASATAAASVGSSSAAAAAAAASPSSSSSPPSSSAGKLRIVSTSFFRCANFLWRHEPTQAERLQEQQARAAERARLKAISIRLQAMRQSGEMSAEDAAACEEEHQKDVAAEKADMSARRSRAQLRRFAGIDDRNPHLLYVHGITKFAETFPATFPPHERWVWRIYYDQSLFLPCGCERCTKQRAEAGGAAEQYRIGEAWRLLFDHLRTLPFVQLVYFNFPAYQLRYVDTDPASGALTRDLRGFHYNNAGMLARFLALADLGHTAELVLLSDIDGTWSEQWKAKLDRMMERKAVCLRACDPAYRVELWGGASAFAWHPPEPGAPASEHRSLCFDGIESSIHAFASWHMRCTDKMRHLRGVGMHFLQHQIREDRRGIVATMREELRVHASDTGYDETWGDRRVERVFKSLLAQTQMEDASAGASSSSQPPKRGGKHPKKKQAAAAAAAAPSSTDAASDDDDDDEADDPSTAADPALDEFKGHFVYGADQLFLSVFVYPIVRAAVGDRESRCHSPQPGSLVNVFVQLPKDALKRLPPPPPTPMELARNLPPRNSDRPEIGKMLQPIRPIPPELIEERVVTYVEHWIEGQHKAAAKLKADAAAGGAAAGMKRKAAESVVKKPAPTPSRLQPQRNTKRGAASSPSSEGAVASASSTAASSLPLCDENVTDLAANGFEFDDDDEDDEDSENEDAGDDEEQPLDDSDAEWSTPAVKKKQRIDRPSSALSGSLSVSPHSPPFTSSSSPASAARPAQSAETLLSVTRDAVQVISLWYSAGASGAHQIRLLRVTHSDGNPPIVSVYAHGIDLGGVVAQRKHCSELLRRFESPSEKLRIQVGASPAHNILTAAGVRRFMTIHRMTGQNAYRQWITQVLLPKMTGGQSEEKEEKEGSSKAEDNKQMTASAAPSDPSSLPLEMTPSAAAAASPRRSHDEEKSRINPHPQPLSPIPDWAAAAMEESQQQQQQQHIGEQSPATPQPHPSPLHAPTFPSSPVAAAAACDHSAQPDLSAALNAPTPMQLDDDELMDLTQPTQPAISSSSAQAPATPSSSAAAAGAASPLTPLHSPATVHSRFALHSPVSSPMADIARVAPAAPTLMSDGEASDASSMPPLSCPSVATESAAAASAVTGSTEMGSRVVSFDLTPASIASASSSSSAAAANPSSPAPAVPLGLDLDGGDWDPRKPPPILPLMKIPFSDDSAHVALLHADTVVASASMHFDAASPAASPSSSLQLKREFDAHAGFSAADDEVGDVDESPMPAAAAKSGPHEIIELDDDDEEEQDRVQSSVHAAAPPAAAAAAASPARTPSRTSSRSALAAAAPSSAVAPARAASSSSAARSSRKSSSSVATLWSDLYSDQYSISLVSWAPLVISFVTENQPVQWKSGKGGGKIFTCSAVKLQKLFTDINAHQEAEVFTANDIPGFAETLWKRLHP